MNFTRAMPELAWVWNCQCLYARPQPRLPWLCQDKSRTTMALSHCGWSSLKSDHV